MGWKKFFYSPVGLVGLEKPKFPPLGKVVQNRSRNKTRHASAGDGLVEWKKFFYSSEGQMESGK